MNELMKIISNPDAALFAIKDILKLDQAIFSKLIKVANSVAHREGNSQRISDISDAMQRIGLEKVKQVALKTSVLKIFTKTGKARTLILKTFGYTAPPLQSLIRL